MANPSEQKSILSDIESDIEFLTALLKKSKYQYYLPTIKTSINRDNDQTIKLSADDSLVAASIDEGQGVGFKIELSFDLPKLIYNIDTLRIYNTLLSLKKEKWAILNQHHATTPVDPAQDPLLYEE